VTAIQLGTSSGVEEEVLRAVRIKAARTGKGDSAVIEEALRRDLGLDAQRATRAVRPT